MAKKCASTDVIHSDRPGVLELSRCYSSQRRKGGDRVLRSPPAESAVHSASGGRFGVGWWVGSSIPRWLVGYVLVFLGVYVQVAMVRRVYRRYHGISPSGLVPVSAAFAPASARGQ